MLILAFFFFFTHHIFTTAAQSPPPYTATDLILLNCGSPSTSPDKSNRNWEGDERSKYAPSNNASISLAFKASKQHSSVVDVPYMTARVFQSNFTYSFPVLTGPKFLRLYFYPSTYSTFHTSQSLFSLTANEYTLLSNFSAFLNSPSDNPAFIKEFIINVGETQRLNLTFSPNPVSFAFVNGIEIVSQPHNLYFRGNNEPIKFVNQEYYLHDDSVLENMYRLNVGGGNVEIQEDSGPHGMFRSWSQDDDYVSGTDYSYRPTLDVQILYNKQTPEYTAPDTVYNSSRTIANGSKSLDWTFPVDSGFHYLLRFHLCEIQLEITTQNQRVFTISVDGQIEDIQVDVIRLAGGPHIPIVRDYVAWVPSDDGRRRKRGMHLSLYPNMEGSPQYFNALLNGLEIFKISDSSKSLAAANPEPDSSLPPLETPNSPKKNGKRSALIYAVVGSVIGVLALLAAISFLIFRRRRRVKDLATTDATKSSWGPLSTESRSTKRSSAGSGVSLPSDLCRHFLLDEIKSATGNFDENFIIGKGGFGDVYRGYIDDGSTAVAIKRLNPSSKQGAREFLTEIEMLSKLRHLHLVSLIGYCDESGEMILVYDYMANGTLRSHLYNSENFPMSWKQRLQICIGAAKGLHYLHTGAKHSIIHRDVKSTNILLDEKWVAKVSDFGLSKVGPAGGAHTHVSTLVKGSVGYMDPEYYRRQQLTDKSDVYSFGVVLLEILCARPAILINLPKEQVNLAEWSKLCFKKGKMEQIIDPNIKGKIAPECLSKFVETTLLCLKDKGFERPAMSDVVWSLEFAMQLQEAADERGVGDADDIVGVFPSPQTADFPLLKPNTTDDDGEMFSVSTDTVSRSKSSGLSTSSSDKFKTGDVFSELFNPIGR